MVSTLLFGLVTSQAAVPTTLADGRKLVFDDEFEVPGRPDPVKWGFETGNLRNDEQQYYVGTRDHNSWVADGCLVLQARRECWDHWDYTSASAFALHPVKAGRVEIRAKFPKGRGIASTLWLLGADYPKTPFPACGEIAIEHSGRAPDELGITVNTDEFNITKDNEVSDALNVAGFADDFHTYIVDIKADSLSVAVDGRQVLEYAKDAAKPTTWPFDKPLTLKLSLAVGGELGGNEGEGKNYHRGVDFLTFPKKIAIDYVRVYE